MNTARYSLSLKDLGKLNLDILNFDESPEDILRMKYNSLRDYLDDFVMDGMAIRIPEEGLGLRYTQEKLRFLSGKTWRDFCESDGFGLNCPISGSVIQTFRKYRFEDYTTFLKFFEVIPKRISNYGVLERFPVKMELSVTDDSRLCDNSSRANNLLCNLIKKAKRKNHRNLVFSTSAEI